MFAFIKKKNLRWQSIFWLTSTFICSFLILYCVDYKYHIYFLREEQWDRLESVTELIATSSAFEYMSNTVWVQQDKTVRDFFNYLDAFEEKTFIAGYFVFYYDGDLNLVKSASTIVPLINDQLIPLDVMKACNNVFYTGEVERVRTEELYYFVKPVVWENTDRKFGICVYSSTSVFDANLQWFMRATSITTVVVLFVNSLLLFFVITTVLFKPLKEVVNTVDLFVRQTFADYFSVFKQKENEIDNLRSAIKRLEALFKVLRVQMATSERYRRWICNVSKDELEKMDVFSGTAEFMALCDKDLMIGNGFAWSKKQADFVKKISQNQLDSLHLCYVRITDPRLNKRKFISDLLDALGIDTIPLDTAFKLSEDSFLFVFTSQHELGVLTDYLSLKQCCTFGTAHSEKGTHCSMQNLLIECIKNAV